MFKNEVIDEYQSDYIELKELAKNQRQELDIGDEIPVANYLVELLRRKGIVLLRYPFRNNDAKPFSGMMLEMDNGNGVHLKKVWIATCEKNNKAFDCRPDELEFVCEKIFSKEPTEQDLICFMSENGLGMYDYCHVKEAYKLDCDFDD